MLTTHSIVFGRQVSYIIGANIALLLLGFIQLPILTKGLGTTLYGTWSLINVTITLIVPFTLIGLSVGIVRFLAAQKDKAIVREDFLSAYSVVFVLGTAFSVLLFLLSDYLATSIFRDINASFYIKLASILIILGAMRNLTLTFFRMQRKIGLYTILNLSYNTFQIGLIVLFIFLGYKLTGVISAIIVSAILYNLVVLFIIPRQIGFQLPRYSRLKSYMKYGIPLIPNTALLWIIHTSDRYMVSYFLGVTTTGIYAAAYTLGNLTSFLLGPVGTVLFPMVSKLFDEGNVTETKIYLKYSVKYLMMLTIPIASGISILAQPLLQTLTNPEFLPGAMVVPWVAFGLVIFSFRNICTFNLYLVKKTHWVGIILGISAILNIGLNLLLIPRMGIVGAAVATLITYGLSGIFNLLISFRYLRYDIGLPFLMKSIVASGIMVLAIRFIDPSGITEIIVSIVSGIIIYFALLLPMRGFKKSEIDLVRKLVTNFNPFKKS